MSVTPGRRPGARSRPGGVAQSRRQANDRLFTCVRRQAAVLRRFLPPFGLGGGGGAGARAATRFTTRRRSGLRTYVAPRSIALSVIGPTGSADRATTTVPGAASR